MRPFFRRLGGATGTASAVFGATIAAPAALCDCVILSVVFELANLVLAITSGSWNIILLELLPPPAIENVSGWDWQPAGGDSDDEESWCSVAVEPGFIWKEVAVDDDDDDVVPLCDGPPPCEASLATVMSDGSILPARMRPTRPKDTMLCTLIASVSMIRNGCVFCCDGKMPSTELFCNGRRKVKEISFVCFCLPKGHLMECIGRNSSRLHI